MVGGPRDAVKRKKATMPKERVRASGNNGYADVLVRWSKQGSAEQSGFVDAGGVFVNLFVAAKELPGYAGGFYFHPEHPETFNLTNGDGVGPVSIDLDRAQINRLIKTLRIARDSAYGNDE
jgi:hypothetical protein